VSPALIWSSVVFYFAQVDDGRRLAILRPQNQTTAESFRLFLGTSSAMIERSAKRDLIERRRPRAAAGASRPG
jgi:hypothetical protein